MTFLKNSLITLTILVISIRVMPATSTDDLQILREECQNILKRIGYKDNDGDYKKMNSTGKDAIEDEDYRYLGKIYIKMIKLIQKYLVEDGKDKKTRKLELTKEKINIFTYGFNSDMKEYLKDQNSFMKKVANTVLMKKTPVTAFCDTTIDEENKYLKSRFRLNDITYTS